MPKRIGLVVHPAAGALLYVIFTVSTHDSSAHRGKSAPFVILPIVMCVLLAVQVGAIRVARRRIGS